MSEGSESGGLKVNDLLAGAGVGSLDPAQIVCFQSYLSLLLRWNARINLTAIRDEDSILARHFVESIACAGALPLGIKTLLDFGSGAGFPGIPIALCRPDIAVTLAESAGKKAAFLQEAVRVLGISAKVHSGRAESLTVKFDCVVMRAVDKMPQAVQAAAQLIASGGWLVLMTTGTGLPGLQAAAGPTLSWEPAAVQSDSEDRVIAFARRAVSSQA